MATTYKLLKDIYSNTITNVLITRDDGNNGSIPFDPDNKDYQEYLKWVDEGNTAEAAD